MSQKRESFGSPLNPNRKFSLFFVFFAAFCLTFLFSHRKCALAVAVDMAQGLTRASRLRPALAGLRRTACDTSTHSLAKDLVGAKCCREAVFDAEFCVDALQVRAHGVVAYPENRADNGTSFTRGDPIQHFRFTL